MEDLNKKDHERTRLRFVMSMAESSLNPDDFMEFTRIVNVLAETRHLNPPIIAQN